MMLRPTYLIECESVALHDWQICQQLRRPIALEPHVQRDRRRHHKRLELVHTAQGCRDLLTNEVVGSGWHHALGRVKTVAPLHDRPFDIANN